MERGEERGEDLIAVEWHFAAPAEKHLFDSGCVVEDLVPVLPHLVVVFIRPPIKEFVELILGAEVDEAVHVEVAFLIHGEEVQLGEDSVLVASIGFAADEEIPSPGFGPACMQERTDVPSLGPPVDSVEDECCTFVLKQLAESLVCWVVGGKIRMSKQLVLCLRTQL